MNIYANAEVDVVEASRWTRERRRRRVVATASVDVSVRECYDISVV